MTDTLSRPNFLCPYLHRLFPSLLHLRFYPLHPHFCLDSRPLLPLLVLRSLLFSHYILFLFTFSFLPCRFPPISSDFYLHRSVLLHQLRSSFYSSFPSCSSMFYDDASPRLGQVLLGPCKSILFYINLCTSCILSLTLTYSILPQIYQGH